MTFHSLFRYAAVGLSTALLAAGASSIYAEVSVSKVSAAIQRAADLGRVDPSTEINITVHLNLSDKAAFDDAVEALYDPASPTFHKWMTNGDLRAYALPEAQREIVRQELQNHGLTILSNDPIGFTIRAHGTIADVERAFDTEIHQFAYQGKTFRANVRPARLSGAAGDYVSVVAGLESHQVRPLLVRALNPRTHKPFGSKPLKADDTGFPSLSTTDCLAPPETVTVQDTTALPVGIFTGTVYSPAEPICSYLPSQLWTALGLDEIYAAGYNGAGQTIVLVEGYGYPTLREDAVAFSKLADLPPLSASNLKIVYPEGKPADSELGVIEGWDGEIALDLDSVHTTAPGAKIVVVATNGQDNEDFQTSILYVAEHDLGNTVSNSYGEDLDLLAGPDEQISWDNVLKVAVAKGISVNFASGDSGDNGVGSPLGAAYVPAVAPHATSVGGTTILNDPNNPGSTITTAWGDQLVVLDSGGTVFERPLAAGLIYGGGGGESIYWPKPSWQKSLPGTGRQTPDVSALADPYTGFTIVLTEDTTQLVLFGAGGTSLACPIFSGFWALASQKAGHALGQAARVIAALPYGSLQDVLPTTDSTPNNVSGTITDILGTRSYSAAAVFDGLLEGNKGFTSALWPIDSQDVYVLGFGLDSSLTVNLGWDNATGWGTPHGLAFIDAVAKSMRK